MRANDLLEKGNIILKNANANLAALKTMHTKIEDEIKELADTLFVYEKRVNTKESKTHESHIARTNLDTAFDNADEILKDELDTFMELVRTKNNDFYNQFQAARVVKDLGIKKAK